MSVTFGASVWNTTTGNKASVAFTPAVGELIVVFAGASNIATDLTVTDNNADGLGTYTLVRSIAANQSGLEQLWVRNARIGSATSTVITSVQASSTGGGLSYFRVPEGNLVGAAAARSTGAITSGTAATVPAPVLGLTPLTSSAILTYLTNGTASSICVPRASYTEHTDLSYSTPGMGLHVTSRASGETSATLTFGGNSPTTFFVLAAEIDVSTVVTPTPGAVTLAGGDVTTTTTVVPDPGAITLTGSSGITASGTSSGVQYVQSKSIRQTATTAGSVTLDAPATAGNLLVMLVACNSLQTDSGITAGTTAWTKDVGGGSSVRVHIYSKVADGGETTLQHTVGSSSIFATWGYEFSFAGHTSPTLDRSAAGTVSGATSGNTGTTATTTDADEALIAVVSCGGSIVVGSPVWSNSFIATTAQTEAVSAYLTVTATGAYTTTWGPWTTSRSGNTAIVTYKWTAGGGPTTTTITPDPGELTLVGGDVTIAQQLAAAPGQLQLAGQTPQLEQQLVAAAGAVTLTGNAVVLREQLVASAGAIVLTGQTVTTTGGGNVTVTPDPGAITIAGQGLVLAQNVSSSAGAISLAGGAVTLSLRVSASAGSMTLAGQGAVVLEQLVASAGSLTLAGQTMTTAGGGNVTITVDSAGVLTLAGQSAGLRIVLSASPGAVTLTGRPPALVRTVVPVPAAFSLSGQATPLRSRLVVVAGSLELEGKTILFVIPADVLEDGADAASPDAAAQGSGAETARSGVTGDLVSNASGPE